MVTSQGRTRGQRPYVERVREQRTSQRNVNRCYCGDCRQIVTLPCVACRARAYREAKGGAA